MVNNANFGGPTNNPNLINSNITGTSISSSKIINKELMALSKLSVLIIRCPVCDFQNINETNCIDCNANLLNKTEKLILNNLRLLIAKDNNINSSILERIQNLLFLDLNVIQQISNDIVYNQLRKT